METKVVPAIKALTFTVETTMQKMHENVGNVPEVIEKCESFGFSAAGPQMWVYRDATGDVQKPFRLVVAKPVTGNGEIPEGYKVEELPEVKIASVIHKGAWSNLPATYDAVFRKIKEQELRFAGNTREVYLHYDMKNEENNITEVQVEIL